MGALCDMSSHNGPQNNNNIDTTTVKHLDTTAKVSISVLVWEYDKNTQTQQKSIGASVYFNFVDTTIYTDSSGYAQLVFGVNTMPFKYGYIINKDSFQKRTYSNWKNDLKIIENVTLYKVN